MPHGHGEIIRGLKSNRENYTLFSLPRNISEVSKDRMVRVEVVSFVRDNFFESEEVVSGNVVSINVTVDGEKVTNLNQPLTFWQPGKVRNMEGNITSCFLGSNIYLRLCGMENCGKH